MATETIKTVDLSAIDLSQFFKHLADCVILTHDAKILMQYRPPHWYSNPDGTNIFGGHVDPGETVMQALVRELHEELGGVVRESDVIPVAAVTEEALAHPKLMDYASWALLECRRRGLIPETPSQQPDIKRKGPQ